MAPPLASGNSEPPALSRQGLRVHLSHKCSIEKPPNSPDGQDTMPSTLFPPITCVRADPLRGKPLVTRP